MKGRLSTRYAHLGRAAVCGFTLLEVLLATALTAGLLVVVYDIVWSALATRESIETATRRWAIGPVVMKRITADIRNALIEPYRDLDTFHAEEETVGGEETTRIDFVTSVRARTAVRVDNEWVKSFVTEIGYRARRSETRDGLLALYRREDFGVDDEPLEGGKYYKLVDGVKSFRIDFFDDDPGEPDSDEAEGEEAWDAKDEGRLPWGCRITLVIQEEVEVDDRGDPIVEEVPEYTFIQYVAFPSRHDEGPDG